MDNKIVKDYTTMSEKEYQESICKNFNENLENASEALFELNKILKKNIKSSDKEKEKNLKEYLKLLMFFFELPENSEIIITAWLKMADGNGIVDLTKTNRVSFAKKLNLNIKTYGNNLARVLGSGLFKRLKPKVLKLNSLYFGTSGWVGIMERDSLWVVFLVNSGSEKRHVVTNFFDEVV